MNKYNNMKKIHKFIHTNNLHNICIYYIMILSVIINIKTLCNINFNTVLSVGREICVCYADARNTHSVKNMKNILSLI